MLAAHCGTVADEQRKTIMNMRHWRKAGAVAALAMVLAAPAHSFLLFGDDDPAKLALGTEYYNAKLGEFVVTVSLDEKNALETGSTPGWERTGFSFYAVDGPAGMGRVSGNHPTAVAVCRYHICRLQPTWCACADRRPFDGNHPGQHS